MVDDTYSDLARDEIGDVDGDVAQYDAKCVAEVLVVKA